MTTSKETPAVRVDQEQIRRIAGSWPKRATVRSDLYSYEGSVYQDPACPDYPIELVPFRAHPRFLAASPEQQSAVLTWGWLAYNERTITLEEHVANPAFTMIMHDAFEGATELHLRKAIQQSLIDEHFHTYMHMGAIADTRAFRKLKGRVDAPPPITYRRLRECQAALSQPWERSMLALAFGIVAEVSVKDFLNLMAQNDVIQPSHKRLAALHNRDEYAHGQLLSEVAKVLWHHMTEPQRRVFARSLAPALEAFVAQDFSAWRAILDHVQIPGAAEIMADVEGDKDQGSMVRDVSSIKDLAEEMGILEQLRDTCKIACLS